MVCTYASVLNRKVNLFELNNILGGIHFFSSICDTHMSSEDDTTWLPSKERPVTAAVWPLIT